MGNSKEGGGGVSTYICAPPYPPPMAIVDLLHEHEMGHNLIDLSNKGHFQGPKISLSLHVLCSSIILLFYSGILPC